MACLPLLIAVLALVAPPLRAEDAIISVPLTVSRPTPRDSLDQLRHAVERGDPLAPRQLADLQCRLRLNHKTSESPAP